jgi:hypothetical protein
MIKCHFEVIEHHCMETHEQPSAVLSEAQIEQLQAYHL